MLRDGHTSMGSIYQRWKLGLAYLLVMPIRKHLNQERLSRAEEKAHFLLGWTINGPLGSKSTGGSHTANLVKGDIELEEKFKRFCNQEFSDSIADTATQTCKDDHETVATMEQTAVLNRNRYAMALP